ncbi:hypothetical protein ATR1_074c0019 [Acetobacter tropicalis]|nr:hypothetical protein ATR1_074c0019 [Acetobacter tropicalis]
MIKWVSIIKKPYPEKMFIHALIANAVSGLDRELVPKNSLTPESIIMNDIAIQTPKQPQMRAREIK